MKLNFILYGLLIITLFSCSVRRFIPEEESLYKGASFKFSSDTKIKNRSEIEAELQAVLIPKPNTSKLGLLAHYKSEKRKTNFIYKFINKKIGEKPVYFSNVNTEKTERLILNRLENLGFFYSKVTSTVKKGSKKTSIAYQLKLKESYKLETYQLATDTLAIYKHIQEELTTSILKKENRFNLAKLKLERERIDTKLKSKGYYNFNADFLIFELDTNQYKNKRFDLYLRLKKNTPKKALLPYRLGKTTVYPNHTIEKDSSATDTTIVKNIAFVQNKTFFKPKRLRPYILIDKNQLYDPKKFKATSRRLSSISTYKYVNVEFEEPKIKEKDTIGVLNTKIYLSPLNKRSLSSELQLNTKSSNFTGPALAMSYTNRNLFKGGEVLKITGEFGFESQFGGNNNSNSALNSTHVGLTGELIFPRLLFPLSIEKPYRHAVPKTRINTGIEYLNRTDLYSLSSFNASFGYQWNSSAHVYHSLNPLSTSFVKLGNTTPEFETILDDNIFLRNSFEQELISGLTYNFTYTELGDANKKYPFFFSSNIDIIGNVLSLLGTTDNNNKKTIFGVEFAQYLKIDTDARFHFNLGKEKLLVTRLYGGLGYAYGNSTVLPFSKQFFSGGPYSIRAFRIRSLGPGTYIPTDDNTETFFDSSGDIKLEANIEYRFPLYSFLKGAMFVDAGNVWLLNENNNLPGGKFQSNFASELAVGAGVGIRVDIQSFVIRLDWAAPLRDPQFGNSQKIKFEPSEGIFNFAIGYPF